MSLDTQKNRFHALDSWFNGPQGSDVANFFHSELNQLNDFLHGETLLQLGNCGENQWLRTLHFVHKWQITSYPSAATTFLGSFNQLAIDRNSIDCIIAPLVLEGMGAIKSPIDEIDRILKPMGYVVFFGIKAFSIWGLDLLLNRLSCFGSQGGKLKTVFSLQRAMRHRGYVQCYMSSFYYIPPLSSSRWLKKLEILNEFGKMISPCPAGFYCLVLQKHQELTPDLDLAETEIWKKRTVLQASCQMKKTNQLETKN